MLYLFHFKTEGRDWPLRGGCVHLPHVTLLHHVSRGHSIYTHTQQPQPHHFSLPCHVKDTLLSSVAINVCTGAAPSRFPVFFLSKKKNKKNKNKTSADRRATLVHFHSSSTLLLPKKVFGVPFKRCRCLLAALAAASLLTFEGVH